MSRDVATPLASAVTNVGSIDPELVENATCADDSGLPLISLTKAEMTDVPPVAGTMVGFALSTTRPTAAVPTGMRNALPDATVAPPDDAVITAVPFELPALNVTTTRPEMSVSASDGSIVPSDVVKMMCVPECGGVPLGSMICAMSCVEPFTGNAVASDVNVIVDPLGASNGTRWHAAATRIAASVAPRTTCRRRRAIFKILSILV